MEAIMTKEQLDRYGKVNADSLTDYLPLLESIKDKDFDSPKDIPVGTIFVQHWLNSISFYEVTRTTRKGVELREFPKAEVSFDHDGGGTGTRWNMPDFEYRAKLQNRYADFTKKYGDVKNDKKAAAAFWDLCREEASLRRLYYSVESPYLKKVLKMVKPCKDGGFYIPGIHQGYWCGSMRLWNGEPSSEHYE